MKNRRLSWVALALVASLLISSVALAADLVLPMGTGLSNVVVQNLSTTAGETATVNVTYYDTDGNNDGTSQATINPLAVTEIKTDANVTPALPDGWQGSAVMSSDREVGAVVGVKWSSTGNETGTFDTAQQTQDAYVGGMQGANAIYLPDLKRVPGATAAKANQVSKIYVQNTEAAPATIYMNYYNRQGGAEGRFIATIPGYSQKSFDLRKDAEVPPEVANGLGTTNDGAAYITSTNKIYAVVQTTWASGWDATYEGIAAATTTLYAPAAYRTKKSDGTWNQYSAVVVQNPSATAAKAYVNYINRDTGAIDLQIIRDIAPFSATGLNTRGGGDVAASVFDVLVGTGTSALPNWSGSVLVTSTAQLVGSSNLFWFATSQNYAGAYVMVGPDKAGSKIYGPSYYRRSINETWGTGAQWSALILQNLDNVARDVTVKFVDQTGAVKLNSTVTIPANGGCGINSRNGGNGACASITSAILQANLTGNFIGGVYVEAPTGSKFIGVVNVVYFNRSSVYNAFAK